MNIAELIRYMAWRNQQANHSETLVTIFVPCCRNIERWTFMDIIELESCIQLWKPGAVHGRMIGPE